VNQRSARQFPDKSLKLLVMTTREGPNVAEKGA
jgi:hypothetical protein